MEIKEIPLSKIIISDLNVRKNLEAGNEDSSLDDLAESIRENGLLNPITVVEKNTFFELIVGQRRFLACKKIGLESIPAIIRTNITEAYGVTLSLIENVHRADMHPIDKAQAFQNLYNIYGTYQRVSKESGVSAPTVKKYITLLNLSPEIQEKLTTSEGTAGIGTLSLLAELFPNYNDQIKVLDLISGFNQKTQLRLLKRSDGKISNLEPDVELALEGAFDIQKCTGLFDCPIIPDELKPRIQSEIEKNNPKKEIDNNFDDWNWVDVRWGGDDSFIRFERKGIEELWGNDVFQAIENLRLTVSEILDEDGSCTSFSDIIPNPQYCIKCQAKPEIIDDNAGNKWVMNLIGISLDNFIEKYPKIRKMCDNPSAYSIDLCESCEKKYSKGELEISFEDIVKNAYRFI